MAEIERRDRPRVYQHVGEIDATGDCLTVSTIGRDRAVRIAREAADVQRYLVVKQADSAAHNGSIRASWRPGDTSPWRETVFVRDPLIFESQAEVDTKSGLHEPAILYEGGVFVVMGHPPPPHAEFDQLGKRAIGAHDSHRMRRVVQRITHVVEIKAG